MEFRYLGNSGLKVSEISYGNWLTHGAQIDDQAAIATVHAAIDAGITTFDTADVYAATKAEAVLGNALKGHRRESLEIFTKVYWPTGSGVNDRGLSRKHIMESCHSSLKRLQTDYVDLYQAHRFDTETPLYETLRAFDDLVRQGKILYVGVSEWSADQIQEAYEIANEMGFTRLVSNQPQYSMLWQVIENKVVPKSKQLGLSQIVWSPLAQGVLTGKYLPGQNPPAGSRASDSEAGQNIGKFMTDEILLAVQNLKPIAQELNLTMAQLALAWVLTNKNVASAIIGATKPEQIQECVLAAGKTLDKQTMKRIKKVLGKHPVTDAAMTKKNSPQTRP